MNKIFFIREFDFETGLQMRMLKYYIPTIGRYNFSRKVFLKNKFIFSKNLPTNTYVTTSSGGDGDFWDCVMDCYDKRANWEVECLEDS